MLSSDDTSLPQKSRSRLVPILCSVLVMAGFILLLVQLGKWTRERVFHLDRYTASFADIECPPPPAQERNQFLSEVQYLGNLPARLHLLDADLAQRLADAFARHPWVEKVEEVKIVSPKHVQVRLVYRTPVLQVIVLSEPEASASGSAYQVDGNGILLRGCVSGDNLARFKTTHPSAGPAGTSWGDAAVEGAARTAGLLRPHQNQLHLTLIQGDANDLLLKTSSLGRVLWGRPPGDELPGEAPAAQKVQRLLDFCSQPGGLGNQENAYEYDVRPKAQSLRRPAGPGS